MIHVPLSLQDGWTPLMWASSKGHITCVQLLLKKGAQVDYQANVSVLLFKVRPLLIPYVEKA